MLRLNRPPLKLQYWFPLGFSYTMLVSELFDPISRDVLARLIRMYGKPVVLGADWST